MMRFNLHFAELEREFQAPSAKEVEGSKCQNLA